MDIIKKINKSKSIWQILPELTAEELEEVIKLASDNYHNEGISLISDEIYDILVEKLASSNPKSQALKTIGSSVKGKKVELPYWMGSMDKIKTEEKLIDKFSKNYPGPYLISDKLDGISCLLTMEHNKIRLYTRGDGTFGQNITHLLNLVNMRIDDLKDINKYDTIAIRGELIMTKENFSKYVDEMSNARNMVAGIVNSKAESVNKKYARDVDFIAYEIIEPLKRPSDQMTLLKKWNMAVVFNDIYEDIDLTILDEILQKRKKKSKYEIDGIIVTDNNRHTRNISGNPPYSFAYKGLTPTANVKVIKVHWEPSKDGLIIPTIQYEKVRLSQADLEYTTGFNAKFIVENSIGPGAIITIVRSGDVIPYIMGVVKPAKRPSLPENLDYVWDKNEVNIVLRRADKNKTVIIKRLTKFVRYIGVDNLSEGIIKKLVNAGYDSIPKIIDLTQDKLLDLDGFQDTLAEKIFNNLQEALDNLDILTLMAASNVFGRGFGERKIKKILDVYPDIVDRYSEKTHDKWHQRLLDLDGFDTITVEHFLEALPDFQKFYHNVLKSVNVMPYVKKMKKAGKFKGQAVVFTGFRNKDWQKTIEEEGGKITNSVSKNTTLLVYNDGEEASSKSLKAKSLGIKRMSKSEFEKKFFK